MEPLLRLQGKPGENPLPDLIREIASRGASGALRFSCDNLARSIYFDAGTPVSVASDLPEEQLEHKLVKEGQTTASSIQAARSSRPTTPLSQALVDEGALTEATARRTTDELVTHIVSSIFDCEQGEYDFDEGARPTELAGLDCTPADLVRGARKAAGIERFAAVIAPPDMLVAPADTTGYFLASLPALDSVESYVLSRIESPTRVRDVSATIGLPEEEANRAVCVLVALGMLARAGYEGEPSNARHEPAPDPLFEAVSRKLELFASADFYAVLGVEKFATAATIYRAFEELERMFDSYRKLSSDNQELHKKLDELFNRVEEAYLTLSDPTKRWAYDKAAAQNSGDLTRMTKHRIGRAEIAHGGIERARDGSDFNQSSRLVLNVERDEHHASNGIASNQPSESAAPDTGDLRVPVRAPIPGLATVNIEPSSPPPGAKLAEPDSASQPGQPEWVTASQNALRCYRQGRVRYEQRDVNGAHHLFGEACRLDPSQSHYHLYRAMTLLILSQARHEHTHHEGCHVTCSLGGALVSNPRMRHEAEQHLLKAAELEPGNAQVPLRLGFLYKEAGMTKKAEHYFRETLMRDGRNKSALFELELLEQSAGETSEELTEIDPIE